MKIVTYRRMVAMTLSVLLTGLCASSACGEIRVKGILSDGREFDGRLLRDDGRRLTVKGEKRTSSVLTANVVECTLKVSDEEIPENSAGIPLSGLGKFLLSKGHGFLGESTLACALARTVRPGRDGQLTLALWAMERMFKPDQISAAQTASLKAIYKASRRLLPARLGGTRTRSSRVRRYQLPAPREIETVSAEAEKWGRKMKEIAPQTHRIETDHFIIFSSWSKSDDARLKTIYQKLYVALCKQFDVPVTENIWIGKLPVFAFWKKADFVKFATQVAGASPVTIERSAGFSGAKSIYQFVCLGPVMEPGIRKADARSWFYELLVHESTHAFMGRYMNAKRVDSWLNEGVAEMLAANLVPRAEASRKMKLAHTRVKQGRGASFLPMLSQDPIPMDPASYGAVQSIARFLVSKSRTKFIQLVSRIKGGLKSSEALKEVYGLTHRQLLSQWAKKVR